MTTFDLDEVRGFAADLDSQMDRCDNGEGMECATLDAALHHYAKLCCKFREGVREWGRAVFSGRVEFDPEVEMAWVTEGRRLFLRAFEIWNGGQKSQIPCYMLEGQVMLQAALWDLYRLLTPWVRPKLAVGPAARLGGGLDPAKAEEARRRIASLPPLPADWQPDDPRQQSLYRKLRTP